MAGRMAYVLHHAPDNASLIVRLALYVQGVPFRTQLVDRSKNAQASPSYPALNPNGLIPTLETPDGVMFETAAILLYLSERHGGLIPKAGPDRALALKWLIWISNMLHPSLRMLFYPHHHTSGDVENIRASARKRITRLLGLLATTKDAHRPEYLPCAASCDLAPMLRRCTICGRPAWFDLADHPRLMDFAARMEDTEPVARAVKAEGLGQHPFTAPQRPDPPEGFAL